MSNSSISYPTVGPFHSVRTRAVATGRQETARREARDLVDRDDDRQVAAFLAGSTRAADILVQRHQRKVLAVVQRMVGDPALAEDLAQEVFVRAFSRLDTYQTGRRFSSWLLRIAHHRAIDHLRRRRPAAVPLEASSRDGEETWEVLEAPVDESSPARRAEVSQMRRSIDRALACLQPRDRSILLLRCQQGLSYREIADVTGQSLGAVKVRLHRARKRLAVELEARGVEVPAAFAPGS
ncbi:MAG: sigma-70 family RNA polymerase sigma factor [Acidobacteriota bacterium]